jgi:hypothetical protein
MERVDLAREHMAERQRWRNGDEWDEGAAKIAVGQLSKARWYVRLYGGDRRESARAYAGPNAEHYARGTAQRWMRTIGGEWVEACWSPNYPGVVRSGS